MSMTDDFGETDAGSTSSGSRPITEHAREIRRDASALAEDLRGTRRELETALGEELTQRPLRTVGIALGIGYVLGGGLTTRLTYSALGTATRLTTMVMLGRELYELSRRWQQGEGHGSGGEQSPQQYSGMGGGSTMGAGSYQGATGQESRRGGGAAGGEREEGGLGRGTPPTETHH